MKSKIKTAARDELEIIAQQEADGTGGSGRASLGPIYRIKKKAADKANKELQALITINQPLIEAKLEEIKKVQSTNAKFIGKP